MTQKQVYDLLVSVFTEFDVILIDKSTWSKIKVAPNLQVYTYGGFPENENSIWYFSVFYNGDSKETMIPEKNTLEFIQLYKEIYLDIVKADSILKTVSERFRSINSVCDIRDKKIDNIVNYD